MDSKKSIIEKQREQRGAMIEDFALIEYMMNDFISIHYFGELSEKMGSFQREILQENGFSTELRKKVFQKLVVKYYSGVKFPTARFEKMQNLRNIIAHGATHADIYFNAVHEPIKKEYYLVYKDERFTIDKLQKKFTENRDIVISAISSLPGMENRYKREDTSDPEVL